MSKVQLLEVQAPIGAGATAPDEGVIGKPLDRVDGPLKVSGGARYAAEVPVAGVLHAVLVISSIAKGRIEKLDASAALGAPGVVGVISHLNAPKLGQPNHMPAGESYPILRGPDIIYCGQQIAVVVADTLERAEHAAQLVRVTYAQEAPRAVMADYPGESFDPPGGFVGRPVKSVRGDLDAGSAQAVEHLDQTYTTPIYHHNAMEPHATLAIWENGNLLCYNATQNVNGNRQALAEAFGIIKDRVRVVNHFVGGGFGSKGLSWQHTVVTALAARVVGHPVKLSLTRNQMYFSNGHRPQTQQRVVLGAGTDGKLTLVRHDTVSHTSMVDDFVEPSGVMTRMMYSCPNLTVSHRLIRLNVGTPTFTRAPGEASGSFAIETAMDELAYAAKMDPIQLRLLNYAEIDEQEKKPFSSKSLRECYTRGAELFGWDRRNAQPGATREGRYLIGMGMASATYPANFWPSSARAMVFSDGRALVQSAAHDLGTGCYTVMTQLAADTLNLPLGAVRFELGDTRYPNAPGAGGSCTTASVGSAVQSACEALKVRLIGIAIADTASPLFGLSGKQVAVEQGRMHQRDNAARGETYAQLLTRRNERVLEASASVQRGSADGGQQPGKGGEPGYSFHGFGAQFAEVRVDADLGMVRVTRMAGVFGAGKILNAKTAHSQLVGGMTWGLGMALLEATNIDAHYGRYTNSNLADYRVPVNADVPDIQVEFIDEKDPYVNPIGVKGIGEIGIVGAAAAIGNAVYHATGKRIRDLPITVDKLI